MKNKLLTIYGIILAFTLTGCDKNFNEINTDPNRLGATVFQYNYLFTSAQVYAAGNADGRSSGSWENAMSYASAMMQHLSSTSAYWYGDKYIFNEVYNSSLWVRHYTTSIKTIIDVMENIRADEKKKNLLNFCRILKVYMFQKLTDGYGDIPYSEAGVGFADGKTTPKYDRQQAIYSSLLKELEEAASDLDAGATNTIGNADVFYAGDVTKWKKFAYSLMVRVAMRMSKVDPEQAKAWTAKAVQGGVMQSNEDNAIILHEVNGPNSLTSNPVGSELIVREPGSYRLSKTFIDFLKSRDDPRLPYLATVTEDATDSHDLGNSDPSIQLGQPNGYDFSGTARDIMHAPGWTGNQNDFSTINRTTFAREDAPTFLLTHGETQLLLAEAAQRGWISGNAEDYYNNGVTASILQLNEAGAEISEQDAADYLDEQPYDEGEGLKMINEQYWLATFADWLETWSNWRRSGFPVLDPVVYVGNTTNGTIPRRFTYPLDEANVNPDNYVEAIGQLNGGDKMSSRVWWDKE